MLGSELHQEMMDGDDEGNDDLPFIVAVIGTPLSGFEIIGPFEDEEEAVDMMQRHPGYKYNGESFWITEVTSKEAL